MDVPIATGTSVHGAIVCLSAAKRLIAELTDFAVVQWPCQGWSDFISKQSGDMLQESEKLFSPTGQKLAIGSDSERVENVLLKDEMRITDVLVLERLAMNGGWKNELY
ncbi:hypothetical protein FocTR4_00011416 [Fusarium oxysporum f. sp. cubense]|uniref:Uncharacterized protein n=1 Tax=Fusarium oxysporum f. sp. cubense TaxID=61366 RepID=A0A5C6SFD4_FUSOC|nr:hypothetical protein FocTR4_00011416 [Fusarium oxysporum f. sp. cubense]